MLKIIDNFTGRLTRNDVGDMNSGMAKYNTTFGTDPFSKVERLTWLESPVQIDAGRAVIQDLIVCAKTRLESGVTYVYAVGHTGRVYKIQVNSPSTHNANFDNPVLLTTLAVNCGGLGLPAFKYGSSMQFFGNTEQIYICHDHGVTYLNFDGTGETYINGSAGNQDNVPRPSVIFGQYLYVGCGSNITQINATPSLILGSFFNTGLGVGNYVRDMDITPDGNYIVIVVSQIPPADITSSTQDTNSLSSSTSTEFLWNGIDPNPTSRKNYNSYSLTSTTTFGSYNYTLGYDLGGVAIYRTGTKQLSLPNSIAPNFEAVGSTGNLLILGGPEHSLTDGQLKGSIEVYGQFDEEVPKGLFRWLRMSATGSDTDVIQMPVCLVVSNLFYGNSNAGYANNQVGAAKIYFSTLEANGSGMTSKFYYFTTVPTGINSAIQGVYETQQETSLKLFRSIVARKFKPNSIRIYVQPLANNNSFTIDLIGSNLQPIPGGSFTFTVGTNCTAGQDFLWYTPATAPTYSLGVRITNLGVNNMVFEKIEIDYEEGGQ